MEEVILSFVATSFLALALYFASALEVAIFSLEETEPDEQKGNRRWIMKLLQRPGDMEAFFIVTRGLFLAGFAVAHHTYLGYVIREPIIWRYIVEGLLFGLIAIMSMSILPASAVSWDDRYTMKFLPIVRFLYILFYPIFKIAKVVLDFILRYSGLEGVQSLATQRKLAYIADEGGYNIEDEERQMIRQIMDFVETTVREVMVPRVDMVCAPIDASPEEIISIIKEKGHSRIPLYDGKIDNIVGILYAKDLLIEMGSNGNNIKLSRICRKPYFVPEAKLIDELLQEFRREKVHIAIVVDEYGGVAGLVTMEDLLEEIIGEIQDEYDAEEAEVQQLDEGVWRVMGKVSIDDISDLLDVELPDKEAETIGGLIYQLAGAIPEPGYSVEVDGGVRFVVEQVDGQRIKSVKVIKIAD